MTSFAHLKLDFYDDPTLIADISDIPKYVRNTKLAAKNERSLVASENHALVFETPDGSIYAKYPVHTPGDTWLSLKSFEKTAHKLPLLMQETAASGLAKAAQLWFGESEKLHPTIEKLASQNTCLTSNFVRVTRDMEYLAPTVDQATESFVEKTASLNDDDYAIVTDTGKRLYLLHTPEHIKKACAWFDDNYTKLIPRYRYQMANAILKSASEKNTIVSSEVVFKYANGLMYSEDMPLAIQLRKSYVVDDTEMHLLNDFLEKSASLAPVTAAELLNKIDERLGLQKYWDREFPDPYASVFQMNKFADYHYCSEAGDVSGSDLRSYVDKKNYRESLESYVAKEVIDELERNPVEVFASLPKPEKELIMSLMKE